LSMIPKSGYRFSEKIMLELKRAKPMSKGSLWQVAVFRPRPHKAKSPGHARAFPSPL
jgi:hypothetical protein